MGLQTDLGSRKTTVQHDGATAVGDGDGLSVRAGAPGVMGTLGQQQLRSTESYVLWISRVHVHWPAK